MISLPNRRPCLRYSFEQRGQKYFGTVGLHPDTLAPSEIFLQGGKAGSDLEAAVRDAAICVSKSMEYGATIRELRDAVTRLDNAAPAGPMGVLLDMLATDMERAAR